jgi:hypothetical protein
MKLPKKLDDFLEGKWITTPCKIKTKNPGMKATLNLVLMIPKAFVYFIFIVVVVVAIPSLILSPIGLLLNKYTPLIYDQSNWILAGITVWSSLICLVGIGFCIWMACESFTVKYKVYKRYYQIWGNK